MKKLFRQYKGLFVDNTERRNTREVIGLIRQLAYKKEFFDKNQPTVYVGKYLFDNILAHFEINHFLIGAINKKGESGVLIYDVIIVLSDYLEVFDYSSYNLPPKRRTIKKGG